MINLAVSLVIVVAAGAVIYAAARDEMRGGRR